MATTPSRNGSQPDPAWYRTAVSYEIHIGGFYDGDGDGSGDVPGLIQKLGYLRWLGVDCIWLLPVYESPKRDGGYDVSDYRSVRSEYGTLEHLKELLEEAHAQGIRVVVDLPISHTSCDHPWFQEARSPESPRRDWYVWSETDDRYRSAKVLFGQTEPSNWTWDHAAGAYFWHRLYSHEPDLNYDNPEVQDAMLDVLRFWLDFGFDGVRLLGVPYMYERDDTPCENLGETHEFLKRMRTEIREHYPDRVLVMEPNQQAHDAAAYFGEGDECHMVNHFPLIPRMFMALWREDATPLYEILDSTPQLPDGCSWALLMRMNDELTLEMVTDEAHDYMYAEYAKDPRMRASLGVRRRVAPLLDNSRDELELLHAALFSLPGSPVLYYGDEIGMGDNIHLGLRDGVRTPMHWTGDRNAGFSRADWAELYLQPLMDPVYGFQAVNVEAQLRTPNSLLSWLARFIALRKQHPVFGVGSFERLHTDNARVFAHMRSHEDEIVICVHNFGRTAEPVQLDLSRFNGMVPEEMFGQTRFPAIGELPYLLTLKPRGFFWFQLK